MRVKMTTMRTKPKASETKSFYPPRSDDDPMSCVWMPINIVIGYFIVSAIASFEFHTTTRFDQMVCIGAVIGFVVICIKAMQDKGKV